MKKLFVLLVIALFLCGVAYATTPGRDLSPGTGDILGQKKFQSDPHKIFRLVRYIPAASTAAKAENQCTVDSVVVWSLVSDDGVTVTTSQQSCDSAVAGIMAVTALTPDTYGNTAADDVGGRSWSWLQTYGKCEGYLNTLENITEGQAVAVGFTTNYLEGGITKFLPSATNSAMQGNLGFAYESSSAAGETDVMIFVICD